MFEIFVEGASADVVIYVLLGFTFLGLGFSVSNNAPPFAGALILLVATGAFIFDVLVAWYTGFLYTGYVVNPVIIVFTILVVLAWIAVLARLLRQLSFVGQFFEIIGGCESESCTTPKCNPPCDDVPVCEIIRKPVGNYPVYPGPFYDDCASDTVHY